MLILISRGHTRKLTRATNPDFFIVIYGILGIMEASVESLS
jgi:hypothetical protein